MAKSKKVLEYLIISLGGCFSDLKHADYVVVHLKKIADYQIFANKNVVNCKFIIDSALNMKIPEDNIQKYKTFAD